MSASVDEYGGGGLVTKSCQTLAACQAPLSMGFSREEYWSGLPCPPPGNLPEPGIKLMSPVAHALAGKFFTISATRAAWMGGVIVSFVMLMRRLLESACVEGVDTGCPWSLC